MKKTDTKMTVKVPTGLLERFMSQLDDLALKRDAFLTAMIEGELRYLENDLSGKTLSSHARRHIAGSLKRMGTKKVNIVVSKRLADNLARCVRKHGLVRDAFVSRLIAFLRSEKALLQALELPEKVDQREFRGFVEDMSTSPLKAIEEVRADPFYYLRVATEERHGVGLYLVRLPRRWDGLACYLDDAEVPGTAEWKARQAEFDELSEQPSLAAGRA